MTIAFYAPLKPPDHDVPSGDRLMARQLMACLDRVAGPVDVASSLRVFINSADNTAELRQRQEQAQREVQRLSRLWTQEGPPSVWFCYHPYYKSPDLLGPVLCQRFNVPYVTAEASYSVRRNHGCWKSLQQHVLDSLNQAAVNICFTKRDRTGLEQAAPSATMASLSPFIDISNFTPGHDVTGASLVTVAMMRRGDKMHSYTRLAAALQTLLDLPWTMSIIGDGPQREDVQQLFSSFPADRISWHGLLSQDAVAKVLSSSSVYVWPGCGEAYGLAYLEAQASGLPVAAYRTAGVPEVVLDGYSGLLTDANDDAAYAHAIRHLINNKKDRVVMSQQAEERVRTVHSIDSAADTLLALLTQHARVEK